MNWRISHRADPVACRIADRHYNRQKVGTPQFVPPGRCLVLLAPEAEPPIGWTPFLAVQSEPAAAPVAAGILHREA